MAMSMSGYEFETSPVPVDSGDRLAGVISHGSPIVGLPMIVPIIAFFASGLFANPRYVRYTAVQAFIFQFLVTTLAGFLGGTAALFFAAPTVVAWIPLLNVVLAPVVALLTWPVALVIGLFGFGLLFWGLVIELIATWKAFAGEPYRMPLIGGIGANG